MIIETKEIKHTLVTIILFVCGTTKVNLSSIFSLEMEIKRGKDNEITERERDKENK